MKCARVQYACWLTAMALVLLMQSSDAAVPEGNVSPSAAPAPAEPYNTGWAVYLDNDAFAGADRNYTGGIAVALSGRRATEYTLSLDPALQSINGWLGIERLFDRPAALRLHNSAFGLLTFTPKDLADPAPIFNDQPYACLVFANNSELVLASPATAYQTTFTLGLLGTDLCGGVQRGLHNLIGKKEPRGWSHQISDGGEPTFQWSLSRQQVLVRSVEGGSRHEVTGMAMGAVGYTTYAAAGLAWRWGRIRSPWWSFTPHHIDFINLGSPARRSTGFISGPSELYLSARVMARYQFYNALLQGQFRDSDVEFSHAQLNPLIGEAWIGVTKGLASGLEVSVLLRARTREVKSIDSPTRVWGSVVLRRAF